MPYQYTKNDWTNVLNFTGMKHENVGAITRRKKLQMEEAIVIAHKQEDYNWAYTNILDPSDRDEAIDRAVKKKISIQDAYNELKTEHEVITWVNLSQNEFKKNIDTILEDQEVFSFKEDASTEGTEFDEKLNIDPPTEVNDKL